MFRKGTTMPKREVPCIRCGCLLLRATYFDNATCGPCRTRHYRRNYKEIRRRYHQQARRYRILMHILGWPDTNEGFADMLEEVKKSELAFRNQAEDRLIKMDVTHEKQARRRAEAGA